MGDSDGVARTVDRGSSREKAVALQYAETDSVPRIVSSGVGEVAKTIIELAKSHGVPVRRDAELVEMLSGLPAGAAVSPESYRLVAEILVFLYAADVRFREKHGHVKSTLVPAAPEVDDITAEPRE